MTFSDHQAPAAAGRSGIDAGDFAAAIAWWRDAGVDHDYADESQSWLAEPETKGDPRQAQPRFEPPPPPPVERMGGPADTLPSDLAAFAAWWTTEPSLDGGQVAGRVAPRGPAGAALMVLVDHPEADDGERLLSGPQGRLLDAILGALGVPADQAYVASVLPRHMPMPDWAGMQEAGLGDITCRHVALAAPQRLLVLGSHISSLLGHDPTKTTEPLRQFAHDSASIPALVAPGLATLMARPKGKARLWQQLLDWSS